MDFTARDFATNRDALIEAARRSLPGRWTSFHDGDFGQALLELVAYDASILSFLIDQATRESYRSTCFTHEAAFIHAASFGYRPKWSVPASLSAWAEISGQLPNTPVTIFDGTLVRQDNGLVWEVVGNHTILPGQKSPIKRVTTWEDGRWKFQVFVKIKAGTSFATLVDENGNRLPSEVSFSGTMVQPGDVLILTGTLANGELSDPPDNGELAITGVSSLSGDLIDNGVLFLDRVFDQANSHVCSFQVESRSITLSQGRVIEESFVYAGEDIQASVAGLAGDTVHVYVNGRLWEQSEVLATASSADMVYSTHMTPEQKLRIKFGDGINGASVKNGDQVSVQYRVCDGSKGNVQIGTFRGTLSQGDIEIRVLNPYSIGSGGSNRETVDELKTAILAHIASPGDRVVSITDYERVTQSYRSKQHGAVAAVMVRTVEAPVTDNTVGVHIWSQTGSGQLGNPPIPLLTEVRNYLMQRAVVGTDIIVSAGRTTPFPLSIRYRYRDGQYSSVSEMVRQAINGVLARQKPGSGVKIGDLYQAVEALDPIDYCVILHPTLLPPTDGVYINSLFPGSKSPILGPVRAGTRSVSTQDTFLGRGAPFSVWGVGRKPTVGIVENTTSGLITSRFDTPLSDDYVGGDVLVNSDYWQAGWINEKGVGIHIALDSGNKDLLPVREMVAKILQDYFSGHVLPGDTITVGMLEGLVFRVPNVVGAKVSLNAVSRGVSFVSSGPDEKLVLDSVSFG